jgi:catechol 2,3-dioxygenase-like lactoylglutathione lyase family enzyme
MRVRGIRWAGVSTDRVAEMRRFATEVLGVTVAYEDDDIVVTETADGSKFELFTLGAGDPGQFDPNPVVIGFLVDDFEAARAELEAADGVEVLGERGGDPGGYRWQHFRAPDGLVYEITYDPDAAS